MDPAERYRRALTAPGGGPHQVAEFSLTPYDRTGIPVVASVWDDGRSDAHGVGYGASTHQAEIGALGELAERVCLAPRLRRTTTRRGTLIELRDVVGSDRVVDPRQLILPAGSEWLPETPLEWFPTVRWRSGETVWVPVEFVAFDLQTLPAELPAGAPLITPITNGLGAGDELARAVGHGLLELLQRDGDTVSFKALDQGLLIDLDRVEAAPVREVIAGLRAVGIEPVVKLAADEFVPVVYCVGRDDDPDVPPMALGAVGEAAHPDADEAIVKCLLEFASSRARRVFAFGPVERVRELHPEYWAAELRRPLGAQEDRAMTAMAAWAQLDAESMRAQLAPTFDRTTSTVDPAGLDRTGDLKPPALLDLVLDRLRDFDVLVVASDPVDGAGQAQAAKVIVPGLEVETMSYHRIGERVAARLLARGDDLVGPGRPDRPGRAPVVLTDDATERLGGPVWFDVDLATRTVDPLYSLYREPRRHAPQRLQNGWL